MSPARRLENRTGVDGDHEARPARRASNWRAPHNYTLFFRPRAVNKNFSRIADYYRQITHYQ